MEAPRLTFQGARQDDDELGSHISGNGQIASGRSSEALAAEVHMVQCPSAMPSSAPLASSVPAMPPVPLMPGAPMAPMAGIPFAQSQAAKGGVDYVAGVPGDPHRHARLRHARHAGHAAPGLRAAAGAELRA